MADKWNYIVLASLFFTLSACSSDNNIAGVTTKAPESTNFKMLQLQPDQIKLYQDGIKTLIPNPDSANFKIVKALKYTAKEGLHICGYAITVNLKNNPVEIPFYVELLQEAETTVVHRGQVGTDEAKLSKVKFVCRHHQI